MKKGLIYMITSPTNRLYVGSTTNLKNRVSYYKKLHCKFQTKLYNSIKKHGWKTHKLEIIWEGNINEMLEKETLIGWGFNTLDKKHLNCKLPKLGDKYNVVADETRKKMSQWQIGRKMSKEAKQKMRKAKLGVSLSKETKEKLSNYKSKPIIQYDLKGNFIRNWKSAAEVQQKLNINQSHIRECCLKKRKTAGKFIWKNK
jgi:group I intron endonuclease